VVIDPCNARVYVSNITDNRIEDYSFGAAALLTPIAVGSQPRGFDVTPDGARLYVANTGSGDVSVVDLATRRETHRIPIPPGFSNDTPLSLAIAANGKALVSTTFAGGGFGARVLRLDLASESVTVANDFMGGMTNELTLLRASPDRSVVGALLGDSTPGSLFLYRSATDQWSTSQRLNVGILAPFLAFSPTGTSLMVNGTYLFDDTLTLQGTIPGGGAGAAFTSTSTLAYRAAPSTNSLDVINPVQYLTTGSIALPDTNAGEMAITSDGKVIAVITNNGLSIVHLP
jgi:YVTN family beta-propeller protein